MARAKAKDADEPLVGELRQIRGLLMLLLLKARASSEEIALATGSGARTVRKDFPAARFLSFGAKVDRSKG